MFRSTIYLTRVSRRSSVVVASVLLAVGLLGACAGTGPGTNPDVADRPDVATDEPRAITPGDDSTEAVDVGYVLGQGDRIDIQVFDEPDLTMQAVVGSTGRISYSYLGELQVAGKTTEQVQREIATLLADGYLRNPSVNVTVEEYRPFFINGEVRSPGSYPYQPGLTLDRAIALAGGLTDRASTRKMFVMTSGGGDERRADMSTRIAPGDIVSVQEGFF